MVKMDSLVLIAELLLVVILSKILQILRRLVKEQMPLHAENKELQHPLLKRSLLQKRWKQRKRDETMVALLQLVMELMVRLALTAFLEIELEMAHLSLEVLEI
jgi:hypothetical protein